ncbi:DUF2934 domain-containing protein [Rhizobacter sp. Root404]|jgi:hypothetical protein|uniref:DUF2934 domain-containing protein n=1 Tax=Rhizobacter sp. Root404 TaxID=1736528 RepID=UPI0006FA8F80|nr:DUF2934 domain-containing protein [Rhizobacter sp. Root404]KQW37650.1 hypothetical protein ASC76_05955 [Rhizobacter sp. Root404]
MQLHTTASGPTPKHATKRRAAPSRIHAAPDPLPEDEAVTRDRVIRETAYGFYEARGRVDGHALDDWFEAEAAVDRPADPV